MQFKPDHKVSQSPTGVKQQSPVTGQRITITRESRRGDRKKGRGRAVCVQVLTASVLKPRSPKLIRHSCHHDKDESGQIKTQINYSFCCFRQNLPLIRLSFLLPLCPLGLYHSLISSPCPWGISVACGDIYWQKKRASEQAVLARLKANKFVVDLKKDSPCPPPHPTSNLAPLPPLFFFFFFAFQLI